MDPELSGNYAEYRSDGEYDAADFGDSEYSSDESDESDDSDGGWSGNWDDGDWDTDYGSWDSGDTDWDSDW